MKEKIDYSIKDIILYSPFEHRSDRRWPGDESFVKNIEDFIEFCYAEPCFDKKERELRKELELSKQQISSTRVIEMLNTEINRVSKKRLAKERFEKSLETISDNPLYIRGFAGTGKSTYMNTLLYRNKKEKTVHSYEIFDMTQSTEDVTFLSIPWKNSNFSLTLFKFISVIMAKLNEILEKKYPNRNHYIVSECKEFLAITIVLFLIMN